MAAITITHTHEDGTKLTGSTRNDGVYEIVKNCGFTWRPNAGIHIRPSRDKDAKRHIIDRAADALREAGHEVTVNIDNTPRPTAVVEAERAERAGERVDRLAARATKAAAEGDAREEASRKIRDGRPFGQPDLVDHHSYAKTSGETRRANAHTEAAFDNWRKARYLDGRAAGAAANQALRENPRTTMNRIDTLTAEKAKLVRERDGHTREHRNGSGRVVSRDVFPPAGGAYRDRLVEKIAHLDEQLDYWRGHLAEMAESGAFVPWSPTDFKVGDRVRRDGFSQWHPVTRVNPKSVSVRDERGYPGTIKWADVSGRRRGDEQLDAPNGEPWPVELANRLYAWAILERELHRNDYDTDAVFKRVRIRQAQRIVLGLALDASDAEVEVCMEAITDQATDRQVRASFFDTYTWLGKDGVKAADVQAQFQPIQLDVAWRMPDREPERRIAAKTLFGRNRDDIIAVQPGDLIVGFYDRGIAFSPGADTEQIVKSFCGPVTAVSEINDRREAGEWVTITLSSGQEATVQTHRWYAVHPAGTWEQTTEPEPVTVVDKRSGVIPDGVRHYLSNGWFIDGQDRTTARPVREHRYSVWEPGAHESGCAELRGTDGSLERLLARVNEMRRPGGAPAAEPEPEPAAVKPDIKVRPWVTAHLTDEQREELAKPIEGTDEVAREAMEAAAGAVDEAEARLREAVESCDNDRLAEAKQARWDAVVALRATTVEHMKVDLPLVVPSINSGIKHVFVPNLDGTKDADDQPVYCIAPCHGHVSMPFHLPAATAAEPAPGTEQRPVLLRRGGTQLTVRSGPVGVASADAGRSLEAGDRILGIYDVDTMLISARVMPDFTGVVATVEGGGSLDATVAVTLETGERKDFGTGDWFLVEPHPDPAAELVWRAGPTGWFTCTGCKGRKLDPSGGSAQTVDGSQTLCRDCDRERIAQAWDAKPAGQYGVAINGELAGVVEHQPAEPHPFTVVGADRTHCGADGCGRLESSPVHEGAEPDPWGPVLAQIETAAAN
jgi:hypothetical protein